MLYPSRITICKDTKKTHSVFVVFNKSCFFTNTPSSATPSQVKPPIPSPSADKENPSRVKFFQWLCSGFAVALQWLCSAKTHHPSTIAISSGVSPYSIYTCPPISLLVPPPSFPVNPQTNPQLTAGFGWQIIDYLKIKLTSDERLAASTIIKASYFSLNT